MMKFIVGLPFGIEDEKAQQVVDILSETIGSLEDVDLAGLYYQSEEDDEPSMQHIHN